MAEDKGRSSDWAIKELAEISGRFESKKLSLYIDEILTWNSRLNLISKVNTPDVLVRLVKQCVSMWDFMIKQAPELEKKRSIKVIDIGSGAGFPGLVWKLLHPEISLTLVERKSRKALFLDKAAALLSIGGIRVIERDVHALTGDGDYMEAFDIASMLAVAPPQKHARILEKLLVSGGFFMTLRSPKEKTIPELLGNKLLLRGAVSEKEGTYVLYKKIVKEQN
jgi:16S rRNA (guanine527-N7)-methyltransferase